MTHIPVVDGQKLKDDLLIKLRTKENWTADEVKRMIDETYNEVKKGIGRQRFLEQAAL